MSGLLRSIPRVSVSFSFTLFSFGSNQRRAVDVDGILYFKDLSKLKDATSSNDTLYVNYNDDRIVFYVNDYTGKDFIAYVCSPTSPYLAR